MRRRWLTLHRPHNKDCSDEILGFRIAMARKATPKNDQTDVLMRSARRCALCYYLIGDLTEKVGQLAHIDQDHSNSAEANLAFLCMEHHTLYDSKTSQHKNYTEGEVRRAKVSLEAAIKAKQHLNQPRAPRTIRRRKPKDPLRARQTALGSISSSGLFRDARDATRWGRPYPARSTSARAEPKGCADYDRPYWILGETLSTSTPRTNAPIS